MRGRLSHALQLEFQQRSLTVSVEPVVTVLFGIGMDQPALNGVLRQIESLGLELVELRQARSPDKPNRA